MSYLRNPDYKEGVRGQVWYPCAGSVAVPVASNQTIYDGDLVSLNANGEAVNVRPATAGQAVGATPEIYGMAVSPSDAQSADTDLYPNGIMVQPLTDSRLVALPFATTAGAPATPAKTDVGGQITLRAGSGDYAGVLVCNLKSGSDAVHGVIFSIADSRRVVVRLSDSVLNT